MPGTCPGRAALVALATTHALGSRRRAAWIESAALRPDASDAKRRRRTRPRLLRCTRVVACSWRSLTGAERARQLPHAQVRRLAERRPDPHAVQDHPVHRRGGVRDRRGRAGLLGLQVPRQEGRSAAQIHGNTRLEIGWTVAAALILVVLTVVTFVKLPEHHQPAELERRRSSSRRSPSRPAQRQEADDLRPGPAVHLALRVRRRLREQPVRAQAALLLPGDGRPGEHHGRAQHQLDRRDPLLVGSVARRQGRRGARLHDLHVVQGQGRPSTTASARSCAGASTRP